MYFINKSYRDLKLITDANQTELKIPELTLIYVVEPTLANCLCLNICTLITVTLATEISVVRCGLKTSWCKTSQTRGKTSQTPGKTSQTPKLLKKRFHLPLAPNTSERSSSGDCPSTGSYKLVPQHYFMFTIPETAKRTD